MDTIDAATRGLEEDAAAGLSALAMEVAQAATRILIPIVRS